MSFHRKYFFFDIDGTLVPQTGSMDVPASTRAALAEMEEEGHFCAICTGRAQYLAVEPMRQLGFRNMVSDGGNGITLDGELLGIRPMDTADCHELIRECEQMHYPWAFSPENAGSRLTPYQSFADAVGTFFMTTEVVPDLDYRACDHFYKVFICCREGEEKNLPMLEKMGWCRHADNHVFIEPLHKEVGIRFIMDRFGAPYEDVVVFGDGTNDVSMFCPEWTGIAMGNAVPELKKRAAFVTKPSAEDGIAYALRHFGWIS